jgi:hypothetical protein
VHGYTRHGRRPAADPCCLADLLYPEATGLIWCPEMPKRVLIILLFAILLLALHRVLYSEKANQFFR